MTDAAPRVVVLGRAGDAQQQLRNALDELGARTLASGDFDQLDPAQVREQHPDVWLVSMDESTDAVQLDRWQPLFDDPDATVIFDDADVTSRLSGWDLARWARHLAAKVLGRDDVLPPVSPDAERLPQHVDAPDDAVRGDVGGAAPSSPDGERDAASAASGFAELSLADDHDPLPSISLNIERPSQAADDSTIDHGSIEFDVAGLNLEEAADTLPSFTAGSAGAGEPSEPGGLSLADDADFAALSASFEAERRQDEAERVESPPAMALDDLLRMQSADGIATPASPKASNAAPSTPATRSGLSLMDMDTDLTAHGKPAKSTPEVNFDLSHLELQPIESPEAKAAESSNGGLIAIVAGLGGPDAVRQFLGALPKGLSVPVLLWQHLDAGKHDRLAQQLAKATELPVYLAKVGELSKIGAVGVMSTGLGVIADSGWWFHEGREGPSFGLAAALNDPLMVIVVLSGAEAAIVEPARGHLAHEGRVLVQTPSTCFDSTAASALDGLQGVKTGSPAELAAWAVAP